MTATLVRKLTKGKRTLGWVVATSLGNALVVRRTPRALALLTKPTKFVSLTHSIDNNEAGWSLEPELVLALRTFDCKHVVVYVPKPGILFETSAANYHTPGVVYSVPKNKSGGWIKCVSLERFRRTTYHVKL